MLILPLIIAFLPSSFAAVTVYGQLPLAQTNTAYRPSTTTLAAYNDTWITPPPIPSPAPPREFMIGLQQNANAVNGLSIPHTGGLSFLGFSIETSVVSQVLGKNSSLIAPTFLNLISNIAARGGGVPIRIGGNTQELAVMLDSIPDAEGTGRVFGKEDSGSKATTRTPAVIYTRDMFYMASNISSLVNVKWFFGIPFNDTVHWRLTIAEESQQILGNNLLGLQAGNEPDFYIEAGHRTAPYNPADYAGELASLIKNIDANPRIPVKNNLIGPSVAGPWTPEQIWDTGYMDRFKDRLHAFAVQHYPDNNCAAQFNTGAPIVLPDAVFPLYLNHKPRVVDLVAPYINSTLLAQKYSKPFIMFETNSAACGGFAGVSNTFGAALWAADYGLQLAYANFSNALLHVGGHNVFYNPFTSPPTNQTEFNQWTVGGIYYSAVILAEALGTSNTSRVIDLNANGGNEYTPAYAIYETGGLSKVAVFNYVDDHTGASNLNITIVVQGGNRLSDSVQVKYFEAPSVSTKSNITWAGQSMGSSFQVDGRFKGSLEITTISCTLGSCVVPLPAPGFALIFINTTSPSNARLLQMGQNTQTYATTRRTNVHNTATVDWTEVSISNGRNATFRKELKSSNYGEKSRTAEGVRLRVGTGRVWITVMTAVAISGVALVT